MKGVSATALNSKIPVSCPNLVSKGKDEPVQLCWYQNVKLTKHVKQLPDYLTLHRHDVEIGSRWTGEVSFVQQVACYRNNCQNSEARILAVQPDCLKRDVFPLFFTPDHNKYDRYLNVVRPGRKEVMLAQKLLNNNEKRPFA